jgi:toxin ParE1/3/4
MNFRISSPACDDLDSVWEYTQDKWGFEQADLYIDSLMLRLIWLTENKALWRSRSEIGKGIFSYAEKSHIIFFKEQQAHMDVLRVLHKRMDMAKHMP